MDIGVNDARSDAGTARVDARVRESGAVDMELEGERGLNLENELAAVDGLGAAFDLVPSMLALRATKMFTEGDGKPSRSDEPALAAQPTLRLTKLAKEAVSELFEHHRDGVQESWGEPLDKEEALDYLVCAALCCELLPGEARTIGKKAAYALAALTGAPQRVWLAPYPIPCPPWGRLLPHPFPHPAASLRRPRLLLRHHRPALRRPVTAAPVTAAPVTAAA